jgi:hypothetical protein
MIEDGTLSKAFVDSSSERMDVLKTFMPRELRTVPSDIMKTMQHAKVKLSDAAEYF